jgi:hypothetical protein
VEREVNALISQATLLVPRQPGQSFFSTYPANYATLEKTSGGRIIGRPSITIGRFTCENALAFSF